MTSQPPAESYGWMPTIKITLIWAVAIALCLVPLTMLFRGNPRAVSLGLFVFSAPVLLAFGALALGGSAYNAPNGLERQATILITAVAVIGLLAILNFIWIGGPFDSRVKWAVLGAVTWGLVFGVVSKAAGEAGRVRSAADWQIEKKEMADPNSEYSKRKAMYGKPLPATEGWLERAVHSAEKTLSNHEFKPSRLVYFGNEKDPESVTVWAVFALDSSRVFGEHAVGTLGYFEWINNAFLLENMRSPVAVGITTEALIGEAGGDTAYFGGDGKNVIPQYDRSTDISVPRKEISAPVKRD